MTTIFLKNQWVPISLDLNKKFVFESLSSSVVVVTPESNKENAQYYSKNQKFILEGKVTPYYFFGNGKIEYSIYSGGSDVDVSDLAKETTLVNIDANVQNIASGLGVSNLVWKDVVSFNTTFFEELSKVQYALDGNFLLLKGSFKVIANKNSSDGEVEIFTLPEPTIKDITSIQNDTKIIFYINNASKLTDKLFKNRFLVSEVYVLDNIKFYK